MICPKCGFDMGEEKTCEKCGWVEESAEIQNNEISEDNSIESEETQADLNSLENINVDFNEVEGTDSEAEDEVKTSPDDLVIDFDEINEKSKDMKNKKSGSSWLVALVSFIAGVLATLIVVGCLNGTVITYFDKVTNGTPYEVIEKFCKSNFETNNAKDFTAACSPFYRAEILSAIQQQSEYYNMETNLDYDMDVTKDSNFVPVAEYFMKNFVVSDTQKMIIDNIEYQGIEYYKSGTDEFHSYLDEYKGSSNSVVAQAKGVSLFAKVSCNIAYTVETIEQTTTTTTTTAKATKKAEKTEDDKETTSATEASQSNAVTTTSNKESAKESCTIVCVKINDTWYVYNGITTDSSN